MISARATNSAWRVPWVRLEEGFGPVDFQIRTFSEALVPLMPLPMISPSHTNTQPTGVSSEASASSAISIALRMKPSWYSRFGIGPNTMAAHDLAMDCCFPEPVDVFNYAFAAPI